MGLNRAQVARELRVSFNAVKKAALTGRISPLKDGTFDLEQVRRDWADNTDPTVSRVQKAPEDSAVGFTEGQARAAVALIDHLLIEQGFDLGDLSYSQRVKMAESILKTHERMQKLNIANGRLIDADAIENEVLDLARQERDELINWPARVAPLIAAELGVDQIALNLALEKHVRLFLSERSGPELRRTRQGNSAESLEGGAQTGASSNGVRMGGSIQEIIAS